MDVEFGILESEKKIWNYSWTYNYFEMDKFNQIYDL